MTIEAKMVRDTEVRTVETMLDAATGEIRTRIDVKRTVRLALTGTPVVETDYGAIKSYRPDLLVLILKDGKLQQLETRGYVLKGDGQPGRRRVDDLFWPNGERVYGYQQQRPPCPGEIMEIAQRYAT